MASTSWSKDWGPLAAQLASMGLPVLGKAVGTIAGSSIPFVGGYLPGVGENIGREAAKMIAGALGVKPDPEAITAAIEAAPTTDVMATLQAKEAEAEHKWPALALMAKEETEQFKTQAADTERARQFALALANTSSPMQWSAPLLAGVITIGFFTLLVFRLLNPPTVQDALLDGLTGSLGTAFILVVGYYFGSSAGSRRKDERYSALAMATAAEAAPQPKPAIQIQPPVTITKSKTK